MAGRAHAEGDGDGGGGGGAEAAHPPASPGAIPHNLTSYGEKRLSALAVGVLRELCAARGLKVAGKAHTATCVSKLLEWKAGLGKGSGKPLAPAPAPAAPAAPAAGRRGAAHPLLAAVAGHTHHDWRKFLCEKHFVRDSVSHHREDLYLRQRNIGGYELRPLVADAVGESQQVDHVFECQVMSDVLFRTKALLPVLRDVNWNYTFDKQNIAVKSALSHAREVHNSEEFLVVCSAHANKKKEGAFRTCLNHLSDGRALAADFRIRDELERVFMDPKGVRPYGEDEAQKMAREVERRLKDMEVPHTANLRDVGQGAAQGRDRAAQYEGIADEVVLMYETFGLQSDR